MKELQWLCERLDLKHIVDKRRLFFLKSQNTVLQICFGLFTHSREFVQLCYKYDIDVALCSSGAIFAAFVVILVTLFFHSKSVCLSPVHSVSCNCEFSAFIGE